MTSIISAPLASGATADIVLTYSGQMGFADIAVYRAVGLVSSTAHDTDSFKGSDDNVAMTLDIPANGILVAGNTADCGGCTNVWTGATEDYDLSGSTDRITGASASLLEVETGRDVIVDRSGSPKENGRAVASWQ